MNPSITVAIVTRNRAKDLHECLLSLARQTLHPDNILIVDNASSDDTQKIVVEFSKKLSIRSVCEKTTGYPAVYNRAIREVKTQWVAFIDDDCVADIHWFDELTKAIKQYSSRAAIIGASKNYYSKNVYACAFQFWYDYWRQRSTSGTIVLDYRTLDSRNVVLNKKVLTNYHINFDSLFLKGAEDSDLGLQIQNHGQQAIYRERAVVYHKEPVSFRAFLYKKRAYAKAERYLTKKWDSKELPSKKMKQLKIMHGILLLTTKQLTPLKKVKFFCLVVVDYIFSRYNIYGL